MSTFIGGFFIGWSSFGLLITLVWWRRDQRRGVECGTKETEDTT